MGRSVADGNEKGLRAAVRHRTSGVAAGRAELNRATAELLAAAGAALGLGDAELTVLYCSEAKIRSLNRDFRGIDKATDVLSFGAESAPTVGAYLGDVAICLPYAAHARRPLGAETALLLVHGLLHLLGHDHDVPTRKKAMWAQQRRLLRIPEAKRLAALRISIKY